LLLAERVQRAGAIDVFHAQFGTTAGAAVALRREGLVTAPIVCSIHGQDANVTARYAHDTFRSLHAELACLTVGTAFMREVVHELGVPREKTALWPQGVDTERPAGARRGPHPTCNVLSVGRLVEFKGVDDSLRAVAAARAEVPDLRYTVIGDGPLRAQLEQLARDLGVADITTFAGALDHAAVLRAHSDADVFLQMGKTGADGSREGQGVAPCEAAVSGLPCVATRSGGLPEVIVDGGTGVLVDPGDVAAAAQALAALAADPDRRREMGDGGRRFVTERFSLSATTDVIEAVYAAICLKNPRRS
jgi:colanic acid/amylovoran biosynthesis glycosyltransferase